MNDPDFVLNNMTFSLRNERGGVVGVWSYAGSSFLEVFAHTFNDLVLLSEYIDGADLVPIGGYVCNDGITLYDVSEEFFLSYIPLSFVEILQLLYSSGFSFNAPLKLYLLESISEDDLGSSHVFVPEKFYDETLSDVFVSYDPCMENAELFTEHLWGYTNTCFCDFLGIDTNGAHKPKKI